MTSYAEVVVLVEGPTEQQFVKDLLAPYLVLKAIYLTPIILSKPGEKGGDVKFSRATNDFKLHLKQRSDTYITLMVDYYGIRSDWPGYHESKQQCDHAKKAEIMNNATLEKIQRLFGPYNQGGRFIPYVSMHEIEALYFSDSEILSNQLGIDRERIEAILSECGEPEQINDSPQTAPSKRLMALSKSFKKTSTGVAIAREIGVDKMRECCPIFNGRLEKLEALV